jgi:hypothetical protein
MSEGCRKDVAVALCYKDFAFWTGYSSVGLAVAAKKTAEELNQHGIRTYVVGVKDNVELLQSILFHNGKRAKEGKGPLTHCVIMAPWITPLDLKALVNYFPDMEFTVKSHCNVAALYGDYRGIGNFRQYADLMNDLPNLSVSGNSRSFTQWFSEAYGVNTFLLPDLYSSRGHHEGKVRFSSQPLRLGAFGALRPEKNIPSAVAAGLLIQNRLQVPVSFHINQGGESEGKAIVNTIEQMSQAIPGFDVVKHRWMPWEKFSELVRTMDLLFQPSFTESFNIVTADGVVMGVPTVVSDAVRWAPKQWKANPDSPENIANVGLHLLDDPRAWLDGKEALNEHNHKGLRLWKNYLYDEEPEEPVIPAPEPVPEVEEPGWVSQLIQAVKDLWS